MFLRARLLFVLLTALAVSSTSQVLTNQSNRRPGSTGTVMGSVRTVDDKAVADARVELRDGMTGTVITSGYTNVSGGFEFQSVPSGSYEIVASSGMEEVRDRLNVQNDTANVNLRMPRMGAATGDGKDTVSVQQLKVPEKARNENKKAQEAMQKKDVDSAWKHVNKALTIAPGFAAGLTTRALLELDARKVDEAIADLETAVKNDAGYGLSFLVLGAAYNQMQHFDDAIRTLDHGVALMPNNWQGYFELGKAYLGKNDLSNAQKQLDRCAQRAPAEYAPLHLVRANLALSLKDYPAAMSELEAFLTREPNSPSADSARKALGEVKAFLAKK